MKSAFISRKLNQSLQVVATKPDGASLTTGVAGPAFGVVSWANRRLSGMKSGLDYSAILLGTFGTTTLRGLKGNVSAVEVRAILSKR
jgi:hypothetical protein